MIYRGFDRDLKDKIEAFKREGKRIVFTNGCFDIIHIGHIRYLKEAKSLGDILIVGLNSDDSVKRLKPSRPINSEDERGEVLDSLKPVDYVVIFNEDTPYELIKFLEPDILVKGGDWRLEDVIGRDIVKETHIISYVEGVSTTEIIRRILKKCP